MFGEHAAFIIPSYVISFVSFVVATIVIWRTHRVRSEELAQIIATSEPQKK